MKAPLQLLPRLPLILGLLAMSVALGCGCTSVLWDKNSFVQNYRPASPTGLQLFYSKERQDILVQYSESKEGNTNTRPRCYWLEPNTPRVNMGEKPHFVSPDAATRLTPISLDQTPHSKEHDQQLHAVVSPCGDYFTLYSGETKLDEFKLPAYTGGSQRAKQVLLTPAAVAIDATIIGGAMAIIYGPSMLSLLSN